ncbi:MAG: hypothetical protein AAFV54_09220, partial [Pseudomonadota bacterium]
CATDHLPANPEQSRSDDHTLHRVPDNGVDYWQARDQWHKEHAQNEDGTRTHAILTGGGRIGSAPLICGDE